MQIQNDDNAYWAKLLNMLLEFQYTLDRHFCRVIADKHWKEQILVDERPITSEPYRAFPCAWKI